MTTTEKIKELRIKSGLTQADVSKQLGVGESAISMWESGKRQPSAKRLRRIANLYEVTVDQLIGYEE